MAKKASYTEKDIITLDPITHIRKLPHSSIEDTSVDGQFHMLKELIDNALDEIENFDPINGKLEVIIIEHPKTYIAIVMDNQRGIPHNKLKDVFTKDLTSGKFEDTAYKYSSGMFGRGAKVTFALSKHFRAITGRDGRTSDLYLTYENYKKVQPKIYDTVFHQGTIVAYEPDWSIMEDRNKFLTEGIDRLLLLFNTLAYFNSYKLALLHVKLNIKYDELIKNVFNSDVPLLLSFLDELRTKFLYLFDSEFFNVGNYIKGSTGQKIDDLFCFTLEKTLTEKPQTLAFRYDIYVPKSNKKLRYFQSSPPITLVNNVLFQTPDNYHIRLMIQFIKQLLANNEPDNKIKQYILNNYYLPIYLFANVKYNNAKFVGLTKSAFKDLNFKKDFESYLNANIEHFNEIFGKPLYELLKNDIKFKYELSLTSKLKVRDTKSLLVSLNFPQRFTDCENHEDAELFICEGMSAEPDHILDSKFQAIYSLSGKPINSVKDKANIRKSLEILTGNKIFQDIIRILNIAPNKPLNTIRFKRIFIMTDADEHGKHISNILLGNFYIINPKLIEDGYIYITIAPLFEVKLKNKNFLIRTSGELIRFLAYFYYSEIFELEVNNKVLDKKTLSFFLEYIYKIGEKLNEMSKIIVTPGFILEGFLLNFDEIKKGNYQVLTQHLPLRSLTYDKFTNTLTLITEERDYQINMDYLLTYFQSELIDYYKFLKHLRIKIKFLSNNQCFEVTPWSLYQIMEKLKANLKIRRLKGIGSMTDEEIKNFCIDPNTRVVYRVTSIGDVNKIFNLLGDDSEFRKMLITL